MAAVIQLGIPRLVWLSIHELETTATRLALAEGKHLFVSRAPWGIRWLLPRPRLGQRNVQKVVAASGMASGEFLG